MEKVTIWNREIFGNHFHKKLRLVARLTGIQKSLAFRPCIDLMDVESTLTSQYHNILLLKEEFWALKSRLHWATLGDRNTSFFHFSTMCKRHHNKIWCLKKFFGLLVPIPWGIEVYHSEPFYRPIHYWSYNLYSICASTRLFTYSFLGNKGFSL